MANQRWMRHPIRHGDISHGGLHQHGTRHGRERRQTGAMPLLDTLLCLKFLGMFPGIILLTIVCLLFWAGAYFLPGPA